MTKPLSRLLALLASCARAPWTLTSYTGSACTISADGTCITSPGWPEAYEAGTKCTMTPALNQPVKVAVDIEVGNTPCPASVTGRTYIRMNNVRYCQDTQLVPSSIVPTGPIVFDGATNSGKVYGGFQLCQYTPPSAPPPSPLPPPPRAPPSPPPPSVPPPPPFAPGMCSDECPNLSSNGRCNDGGPGSVDALCGIGTDCADCGHRALAACSRVVMGGIRASDLCFDFMPKNAACDGGCNTFACGHDSGDCSSSQIEAECIRKLPDTLLAPPQPVKSSSSSTAEAWVQLALLPIVIEVNDMTKQTHAELSVTRRAIWHDARLFDPQQNPCLAVIGSLLSLSNEEAQGDASRVQKAALRARFWLPEPAITDLKDLTTVLKRSFRLSTNASEMAAVRAGAGGAFFGAGYSSSVSQSALQLSPADAQHAQMEVEESITVKQRHFEYFNYPFDVQELRFLFKPPDSVVLSTCGTPVDGGPYSFLSSDSLGGLLPPKGDWRTVACGVVNATKFPGADGARSVLTRRLPGHGCELSICIQRIPTQYIFVYLIPNSLVVLASLLSMFPGLTQCMHSTPHCMCSLLTVACACVHLISFRHVHRADQRR